MKDDLIRRSDAENIFRSARRAMKPENYSGQEFFIRDNILLNAEQIVHSVPAVDAVEVVHGHWITEQEAMEKDDFLLKDTCSVCGRCDWDCTESSEFNYCPNCGARMDGQRREDGDNGKHL